MVSYPQLIKRIISEQELVIGPIAWIEARKVPGLRIDEAKKNELVVGADGKKVLENLVMQYDKLFGLASREVCRSAVVDLLADMDKKDIPEVLL